MANTTNHRSDELADLMPATRVRLCKSESLEKLKKLLPEYFKTRDLIDGCNRPVQKIAERAAKEKFIASGKPGDLEKIKHMAGQDLRDRKRSIQARCWNLYNQNFVPLLRSLLTDAADVAREQVDKLAKTEKASAKSYGISFEPSRTLVAVSHSARRIEIWRDDMITSDRIGSPPNPVGMLSFILLEVDYTI